MDIKVLNISTDRCNLITAAQIRAARALLGIDQRQLAEVARLSIPTIQRMEASTGTQVRGNVESLTKVVNALETAGIGLIGERAVSSGGGRGVRLKSVSVPDES